uniref:Uncharacterized protein n=1 Tax=Oryza nivara TaxID=4536 RepID=A0A0E0I1A1_ORYNI
MALGHDCTRSQKGRCRWIRRWRDSAAAAATLVADADFLIAHPSSSERPPSLLQQSTSPHRCNAARVAASSSLPTTGSIGKGAGSCSSIWLAHLVRQRRRPV